MTRHPSHTDSESTAAADSIHTMLAHAAAHLAQASDTPQLDARLLLAHVLDKPHSFLFAHADRPLTPDRAERYRALVARRAQGEPVAYVTGEQGFWSLELAVNDAVLVPRPETELLVELALARLPADRASRIADLGTGSGAIALAIAAERPACHVLATDMDTAALAVARDNAERLGLAQQVTFREGDWYAPLAGQRFELLVSNPPYVADGDSHLPALRHEPRGALVAAEEGMACLRLIIAGGNDHLVAGGWLLVEHGHEQDHTTRELMKAAGFVEVATESDLAGQPRVTLGRRPEGGR